MSEKKLHHNADVADELPEGFGPLEELADSIKPLEAAIEKDVKKNVPKKKASKKNAGNSSKNAEESTLPCWNEEEEKSDSTAEVNEEHFFDLLAFPSKNSKEASAKSEEFEATKFNLADSAELKVAPQSLQEEAVKKENATSEAPKSQKKKKSFDIVEAGLRITKHSDHAKLIFYLCMALLSPVALLLALAVLLLFLIAASATVLAAGMMAIGVLFVVVAGVVVSLVGIAYGAICLLISEGFATVVGQYELGLGVAVAGITIVISALLYSGITDLVPYLFKKMGKLFTYLLKKSKELIVRLYKYSTQL